MFKKKSHEDWRKLLTLVYRREKKTHKASKEEKFNIHIVKSTLKKRKRASAWFYMYKKNLVYIFCVLLLSPRLALLLIHRLTKKITSLSSKAHHRLCKAQTHADCIVDMKNGTNCQKKMWHIKLCLVRFCECCVCITLREKIPLRHLRRWWNFSMHILIYFVSKSSDADWPPSMQRNFNEVRSLSR